MLENSGWMKMMPGADAVYKKMDTEYNGDKCSVDEMKTLFKIFNMSSVHAQYPSLWNIYQHNRQSFVNKSLDFKSFHELNENDENIMKVEKIWKQYLSNFLKLLIKLKKYVVN